MSFEPGHALLKRAWVFTRSVVLAAVVPALIFVLLLLSIAGRATFSHSWTIFLSAVIVSAGHLLLLGLPAVFILQRIGLLNFRSLLATGFTAGALPTACVFLITWATAPEVSVVCQADPECLSDTDGQMGWHVLVTSLCTGGLGLAGALSFYVSSRKIWLFQNPAQLDQLTSGS